MHYEICVAKRDGDGLYYHLFATSERSIRNVTECERVYAELKSAFPEPAYQISITRTEHVGYIIDPSNIRDRGEKKY